jgi:rhamnose transport system substrate-binding protein
LLSGKLVPGEKSYDGGKLGKVEVEGDNLILGQPFIFTKDNIDQFEF